MQTIVTEFRHVPITVAMLIAVAGFAQWLLFASVSLASRGSLPRKGLRPADQRLLISGGILLIAWGVTFGAPLINAMPAGSAGAEVKKASRSRLRGSCALVAHDQTASTVQEKLGEPDQKLTAEETRGPGATIWVYRNNQCAVSLFDDRVDFVE